jgi:diguanylate cyclase (GGDEF)-like protein
MHVLLVHDPTISREPLREALAEVGADVLTVVRSADEAIALVHERGEAPDLAVFDLLTGGGRDGCRRLAMRLKDAPLLVVAPEDQMVVAYDEGADDCIALPLRRGELIARVRVALQLHAERQRRIRRERKLTEELRALQREKIDLERTVCVDSLTGLANRRHALALLAAEWKRSARDGTPLSLVMVDLDCFHAFNETYGHQGGDHCLRDVTDAMVACLRRPSDFLGRYGGEEFIAVLANTDALGAQLVAERMRATVEALAIPHTASECALVVTISVGFATARASLDGHVDQLVKAADLALLSAKTNGRNRTVGEAPPPPPRPRLSSQPWRRFPVVIADPWFADRIPAFLAVTRNELPTLRQACDAGAFDRVKSLARSLRASANDHSIETIAQLATLMEQAARGEDRAALGRVIDEIGEYVTHVQVTYRRAGESEAC